MEIIHLVMGKANPDRMNGVNKVVHQLATQQVAAGLKAEVWGFTHDLSENYPERNFTTSLFRTSGKFSAPDQRFLNSIKALDTERTVFHLHGGWIPQFYKAAKALKKAGLKYVITGHGAYNTVAMQRSKLKKLAYFQLFEKILLKNAAAIHCIGASEVTGLNTIFPTDRTLLIPYGMEFNKEASPEASTSEPFVFGFVGRLDYHTKGLDLMLTAFAQHFRGNTSVVLWLIGDGGGRRAVTELIEQLGISDNVILWGAKFGKDKDALLRQMNVFLHPSRNEGLPSAVLEAAAFSVPCIVSEATNVGEYIKQHRAGFVVGNNDAPALGSAMNQTLHLAPRALKSLGKNAAQMVAEQFNWPRIVKQFNQLYA
ncbi:glycosyltransferase family 4 protein [Neolewinella aurantiaca]|uniref:Glycosyltransferase family 4 protein n=1 Tax=Neolewinella aurantiaca TaxID=2602767 RepID=A0A5C7F9C0_9BACT|nr:glycosyltransferase family 4 protein [Neolewinella aurantiaca]TXF85978.1 glycosyltransferase family 4 protein [Neolewinella aurantiaca]